MFNVLTRLLKMMSGKSTFQFTIDFAIWKTKQKDRKELHVLIHIRQEKCIIVIIIRGNIIVNIIIIIRYLLYADYLQLYTSKKLHFQGIIQICRYSLFTNLSYIWYDKLW
jgi:hypothetical protein